MVETPPEIQAAYGLAAGSCTLPAGETSWADWLSQHEPFAGGAQVGPGSMIYTSGTTGKPKGVRRQQSDSGRRRLGTLVQQVFGLGSGAEVTVVTGPMYHSAPNAYGMVGSAISKTTILQPRFDPEGLLAMIEARGVTHLHMVPTMFVRLLNLPPDVRKRHDLSSLRFVVHFDLRRK